MPSFLPSPSGQPSGQPTRWPPEAPVAGARGTLVSLAFVVAVAALAMVFHGGASTNAVARALTVLGLVEHGTLRADQWADLTIDGARIGGHAYSDKAPLSSFLVVPFYWLWRALVGGPCTNAEVNVAVLLGAIVTSAIPFGLFAELLRRVAARRTGARDAVWTALLAAFGTCVFCWAGEYLGNVLAGTLLVLAYHFAVREEDARAGAAGILAGLAVLAEYPMAIGAAVVAVYVLAARGVKPAARYVAGSLPSAVAMLAYNLAVTGSALDFPQRYVRAQFFPPWGRRFALDAQALDAAKELLFSDYRGAFVYAPVLLLLLPLAVARAQPTARRAALLAIVGAQFTLVASYWAWQGGWTIGPRHLAAVIMTLLYEGVSALARSPRAKVAFVALSVTGLALNLLADATNPLFDKESHPFANVYWPAFVRGEITSENVFTALGLNLGRGCVLVWCALFIATGVIFARISVAPHERPARDAA